jgi:aspartate-semialdehyde dehydrogenase
MAGVARVPRSAGGPLLAFGGVGKFRYERDMLNEKIDVGVLGATGTVGERLVRLLHDHPWFRLTEVGASERSAGARLGDLIPSNEDGGLPPEVADLPVRTLEGSWSAPLLLSALPSGVARDLEPSLAAAGHLVVSNASSHRMGTDVPLVIPEINPDHLDLVEAQAARWSGGLITNPNCAVTAFALPLAALDRAFGLERVVVTTFQSISGAGKPGPSAGDLLDNVIPYIGGEEEKIAAEPRKILGRLEGGRIVDAEFVLSATATRVPVAHGHLVSLSVTLAKAAGPADVAEALRAFRSAAADDRLPSAPERAMEVLDEESRPQPRLDRDRGQGMTVSVGRIRPCEVGHVKFLALSHNLVRGAAGAALLNAELCHARGLTRRTETAPAGAARAGGRPL